MAQVDRLRADLVHGRNPVGPDLGAGFAGRVDREPRHGGPGLGFGAVVLLVDPGAQGGAEDQQGRSDAQQGALLGRAGFGALRKTDRSRGDGSPRKECRQIFGHVQGGCVAVGGVLLQGLPDDGLQVLGQAWVQLAQGRWHLGLDLVEDLGHGTAGEGRLEGQHLEEHRTGGVDVRALVDAGGLSDHLLGTHVVGRARHIARSRDATELEVLGQAKVDQRGLTRTAQNVGGLDVPVKDVVLVDVANALEQGEDEARAALGVTGLGVRWLPGAGALQDVLEGGTLDQLHGVEDNALLFAKGEHGGNAGVVQLRRGQGLTVEARQAQLRGGQGRGQDLDRHIAV